MAIRDASGIVAGQVGVVLPGELAPRRLDLGRRRGAGSTPRTTWGSRFATPECIAGSPTAPVGPLDSPRPVPCTGPCLHSEGPGIAAAIAATPFALAYRFAVVYRRRAGFPRPRPPSVDPSALGLAFEDVVVPSPGTSGLPGWFLPARGGEPGPGVALVHGWESARDRTLPIAEFLLAAGFHCLTIDVRGHGANPPETLPVSAGEFGTDALAAFEALIARPEVTVGAIAGHSLGGIGALLAGRR